MNNETYIKICTQKESLTLLLSEIIVIVGIAVVLGHSTSRPICAGVLRRAVIRVVIIRKYDLSLLDSVITAWWRSWMATGFCRCQVSGVVPWSMPTRKVWWARLYWVSVIGTVLPIDSIDRAWRCLLWQGVDQRVGTSSAFFGAVWKQCCSSSLIGGVWRFCRSNRIRLWSLLCETRHWEEFK